MPQLFCSPRILLAEVIFCGGMCFAAMSIPAFGQEDEAAVNSPPTTEASEETTGAIVTFDQVRKLLRQLESNELAQRDAAEQELVKLGSATLSFLPQVTPQTSGEMKVRLQRIRQALQSTKAEAFFEATLVSLEGKMTFLEAIAEIKKQTGNTIILSGGEESIGSVEVEVDAEEEPFWSVVGKLMEQAKLRINAFGTTESELVLAPGAGKSPVQPYVTGPFHLDVTSVQTRRYFNSQLDGQLELSFQFSWEPRLQPVFMQVPMSTVAVKIGSETLKATNPNASPEIALNLGGCSTQVDLQLERPSRDTKVIDSLVGELTVAIPGERHEYIFEKFGNGARQSEKYGDVTVTLEGARRNGAVHEMRLFIEFGDAQGALESFRGWILSNQAYLTDPQDSRVQNVGLQTYAITGNAVGIAYLFQINGDPNDYKLVYESPAAITKQKIQYELKDIELP